MQGFRDDLQVRVLDDGRHYQVLKSFKYYRVNDKDIIIHVGKGFITDFASVPRIFWSIFPPFGRYTKCAILHDRLCEAFLKKETWSAISNWKSNKRVTRKEADNIFLESMRAIKIGKFTCFCLYASVRLYGILKYGKNA